MKRDSGDFYVGYQRQMPSGLARFLRLWLVGLGILAASVATFLALGQREFEPGVFEYGTVRQFEGVLRETPVPSLEVDRPGEPKSRSVYSLVTFGKQGAEGLVAGRSGERVKLEGTLIYREGLTMIEVASGSLEPTRRGSSGMLVNAVASGGSVTLEGEIVDSKCYLGVMKPGRRKSHRACAVRCLSGGIPPILVVETSAGEREHLFLVDETGVAPGREILDRIAEPVRVQGQLSRVGDQWVLTADPAKIERVSDMEGIP